MLADGILDSEESQELLALLHQFTGEPSIAGELAKSSTLPVETPLPNVVFEGNLFLFTGACAFGTRKQCKEAVESLGGVNATGVTKKLNYLVLDTYVTDSWAHESYGRKIEKAMEYRNAGVPLSIITEEHWALCGNI